MVEKVANKPKLMKPPQMIEYLQQCDDLDKKKAAIAHQSVQPPQLSPSACIHQGSEDKIDDKSYGHQGISQLQYNNNIDRGNNTNLSRGQSTSGGHTKN